MCGIVGFITLEKGNGAMQRSNWFEQAIHVGSWRGQDSTGVFGLTHDRANNDQPMTLKSTAAGPDFLMLSEYEKVLGSSLKYERYRALIGHNRAATRGNVTTANAHPFTEGPITLVHNGTLDTTYELQTPAHQANKGRDKKKAVEVDSHVIALNLAQSESPDEVLRLLDGAYALVWHDARNGSLNAIRNNSRPLHFMGVECESTVLLASEAEMLYWLAQRNNFKVGKIAQPDPGVLLTWRPGEIVPEMRKLEIRERGERMARHYGQHTGWSRPPVVVTGPASTTGSPVMEGSNMGKAPAVSDAMELELMALNIDSTTELTLMPTKIKPVHGKRTALVSGPVWLPDGTALTGLLSGLDYNSVKDTKPEAEGWTVKAYAVMITQAKDTILRVHLVNRNVSTRPAATTGSRSFSRGSLPRLGSRGWDEWVPGPDVEYLSMTDWMRETSSGCFQCGIECCADDAEKMSWAGVGRPVCRECTDDNLDMQRTGRIN